MRDILSDQYNLGARANCTSRSGTSTCVATARSPYATRPIYADRLLDTSADEVLRHVARLWGFTVRLESVSEDAQGRAAERDPGGERRNHPVIP